MKIECSNEMDLVQQTLNDDTSAFDRLVKIHRTTIYALVLSYIKNPADAEDLTQRIFIRAYERLATLRELDRFRSWLLQIAHNTCKDWLRRQSGSTTRFEATNDTDFAEVAPSPEDIVLKAEIETVVRQAISTLRETDRRLMEARYIEGADYDQLQVESGLSYAAIANRLKRAKQEVRHRIEKLLGGVVILPGKTFILGGVEAVKLSVKAKLAAVGVAAVIGIGGGGVVYHHTFESNPVAVNEQTIAEANTVTTGDSSTRVVHPTNVVSSNSFLTNGAADKANRSEIPTDGVMKTTTIDLKNMIKLSEKLKVLELSEEAWEILEEFIHTHGGDVRAALEIELASNGEILSAVKTATRAELTEEIRQAIEERKNKGSSPQVLRIEGKADLPARFLAVPEGLKQKIQSGEVDIFTEFRPTVPQTPSTLTESQSNSTHSVLTPSDPSVESVSTRPEISEVPTQFSSDEDWAAFEELLSTFSDDEWAELERLLGITTAEETPQEDEPALPNVQPQQQIEEAIEEPPIAPLVRQEMRHEQHLPLESDTGVPLHKGR